MQKVSKKGEFSDEELRYLELKDFREYKRNDGANCGSSANLKDKELYVDKNGGFNSMKDAFQKWKDNQRK